MTLLTSSGWDQYILLDSGNGQRLEQFGDVRVVRPDPQCIWKPSLPQTAWEEAQAVYIKEGQKGSWLEKQPVPARWQMQYQDLAWWTRLTPFKHTGVFPEQHLQWDWMREQLQGRETPTVLNLFAYTGIASLACAKAGAQVTHVDASKPTLTWANENRALSGLPETAIRWILDDVGKFVEREVRRGKHYDAIILDPPAFGHGPTGKPWRFHDDIVPLLTHCRALLSENPCFVVMNAYAISSSALLLENLFADVFGDLGGTRSSGELVLAQRQGQRLLSTGLYARWNS